MTEQKIITYASILGLYCHCANILDQFGVLAV